MSSFSSLGIGQSAIHAAQRGLDVTGQNIANSATEGYTRQRVDLAAVGGPGVPAFWSRYDGTGEGVRVTGVNRMHDEFLAARARVSNAALGRSEELAKTLAAVERTVDEPSDTGLQSKLADFWNAWGKISNDPTGQAPRNLTYQRGVSVAGQLNNVSAQLQTQWEDTHAELSANIADVNAMAKDVANLNRAIRSNTIANVPSNELLDQRDLLVAQLAKVAGATAKPMAVVAPNEPLGAVDVFIGSVRLVEGINANTLTLTPATIVSGAAPAPVHVDLTDSSAATVSLTGNAGADPVAGAITGQLQALNITLPDYVGRFDAIAQSLADTVNTQQALGYTVGAAATDATPNGAALFTAADGVTTTGITAKSIRLAAGSTADSLAISTGNPTHHAVDNPNAVLNGDNAMAMAAHLSALNGPGAAYSGLVVQLGVQAEGVNRNVIVQSAVVRQAEDARDNVSGVSLNEEMANLVQYQHSFSAAARFISVIDTTLETLINMVR